MDHLNGQLHCTTSSGLTNLRGFDVTIELVVARQRVVADKGPDHHLRGQAVLPLDMAYNELHGIW